MPKLAFCVKGIEFECRTVQIFTDVIEFQSKVKKIKELKKIVGILKPKLKRTSKHFFLNFVWKVCRWSILPPVSNVGDLVSPKQQKLECSKGVGLLSLKMLF